MKSITLHNLDGKTVALIEKMARETDSSLNKIMKKLLNQALGISPDISAKNEFEEFCGIWKDADFLEFQKNMQDFDKIDSSDWA